MSAPRGLGVHYPYGIAGGTHPGGVADCPTDPCAQRRQGKADREAAEQAQLAALAGQVRAARAHHDARVTAAAYRAAADDLFAWATDGLLNAPEYGSHENVLDAADRLRTRADEMEQQ